MKKIIFRFLIFILLLIFGFITYLSTIGIKTNAFNDQISKEVKKINNQLELELDKISIILDPFKLKLVLKTIGANLKNKNKLIKLESIKSNIDIKTFINIKLSLSELDINTRSIEIKNLISFVRSIEDNPQISFNFSGTQNTARAGTPVPIVYGEIFTGSVVISGAVDTEAVQV